MNTANKMTTAIRNLRRLMSTPVLAYAGAKSSEAVNRKTHMTAVHKPRLPKVKGRGEIELPKTTFNSSPGLVEG
jgi:hypothetical protein